MYRWAFVREGEEVGYLLNEIQNFKFHFYVQVGKDNVGSSGGGPGSSQADFVPHIARLVGLGRFSVPWKANQLRIVKDGLT